MFVVDSAANLPWRCSGVVDASLASTRSHHGEVTRCAVAARRLGGQSGIDVIIAFSLKIAALKRHVLTNVIRRGHSTTRQHGEYLCVCEQHLLNKPVREWVSKVIQFLLSTVPSRDDIMFFHRQLGRRSTIASRRRHFVHNNTSRTETSQLLVQVLLVPCCSAKG